jgi:hypothetical protein
VLDQPSPHRARAHGHHNVVDRAAVVVLHLLDLIEADLAEGEPAVRRDPPVERGAGRGEVRPFQHA